MKQYVIIQQIRVGDECSRFWGRHLRDVGGPGELPRGKGSLTGQKRKAQDPTDEGN